MSNAWSWAQVGTSNSAYGNFPVRSESAAAVNQVNNNNPSSHLHQQQQQPQTFQSSQFQGQGQPATPQQVDYSYQNPIPETSNNVAPVPMNITIMPQMQPSMNSGNADQHQNTPTPQGDVEYLTGAEAEAVLKQIPNFPYPYDYQNQKYVFDNNANANAGNQQNQGNAVSALPAHVNPAASFPSYPGPGMSTSVSEPLGMQMQIHAENGSGEGKNNVGVANSVEIPDGTKTLMGEKEKDSTTSNATPPQQEQKSAEINNSGVGDGKKQAKGKGSLNANNAKNIRTPAWMRIGQTKSQPQFIVNRLLPSYESPPFVRPIPVPIPMASASASASSSVPNATNPLDQNNNQSAVTKSQMRRATKKPTFNLCGKCIKCKLMAGNPANSAKSLSFNQNQNYSSSTPGGRPVTKGGAMGRQSSAIVFPNN